MKFKTLQKQLPRGVLQKAALKIFSLENSQETPALESLFRKASDLQLATF